MGMYTVYILYGACPLFLRLYAYFMGHQPSLFPFPGTMMLLVQTLLMACLPLQYMLFPPTIPERDDLMEVAGDGRGLSRPKEQRESVPPNAVLGADILKFCAIWASL